MLSSRYGATLESRTGSSLGLWNLGTQGDSSVVLVN